MNRLVVPGIVAAVLACGSLESQQAGPFRTQQATAATLRRLFLTPTPVDWETSPYLQGKLAALAAAAPASLSSVRSMLVELVETSNIARPLAIYTLEYVQSPAAVTLGLELLAEPRSPWDSLHTLAVLANKSDPQLAPVWRTIITSGRGGSVREYAILGIGLSGDDTDLPSLEQLARQAESANTRSMAEEAAARIRDPSRRRAARVGVFANPDSQAELFVPAEPMARAMSQDLCRRGGAPRFNLPIVADWCGWALRAGYSPAQ